MFICNLNERFLVLVFSKNKMEKIGEFDIFKFNFNFVYCINK